MQSRTIRTVGLVAVTLGLGAFAYGRATDEPIRALRTVTITTRDFAFEAPDTLEAGPVTIHMVNQGKELHHVWLIRLAGGHTLDQTLAAFKSTGKLPGWVKEFGGPNAPHPQGGESSATVVLESGSYVMACLIPGADRIPHIMKGMVRPFTVIPATVKAASPKADVVVTLEDFAFTFSRPLKPGKQVIEVQNHGSQSHELVLVKLVPGKTVHDVIASIEDRNAEQAGMPVGGVTPMSVGESNWVSVDLEPGTYGLICFIPDQRGDGKPHFMHGMTKEFEVGEESASR
jgi:hypothetical protein